MSLYPLFRFLLFRLEPEQAHALTLKLIRLAGAVMPVRAALAYWFAAPSKPVKAFGLSFKNPVGLAAGYDKDGLGWRGLASLGFGHIEIGTVTPLPQSGNPQPRLFRLPEQHALINRMGFPGRGAEFVTHQLLGFRPAGLILGVNLGKNKDTPLEKAALDYLSLLRCFAPLADYMAINVSSPNTVGLRRLQARDALAALLLALDNERLTLEPGVGRHIPILVKLAPDLTDAELEDSLDAIQGAGMDGVIATNTTIDCTVVAGPLAAEVGGLSGKPLRASSTQMVRQIYRLTQGKVPIIGVGGIGDAASAREKLDAGAVLVQVYTGMVYSGPALVRQILRKL
jgi:dihydroorotate dehydrogenase